MVTFTKSLFKTGQQLVDELNDAPNPKPTATDKARFGKLASLYTAFSGDFAAHALDICLRAGCTTIADPFSGMGTLAEAGRSLPIDLRLGDISPFAALSGAFRSAPSSRIKQSASLLEELSAGIEEEHERAFFAQLFEAVAAATQIPIASALATPSTAEHQPAALTIYLAALSRMYLYRRLAGSNPTWIKRPDAIADRTARIEAVKATVTAVREFARLLPDIASNNQTTSAWCSIDGLPIVAKSLDAIITSPPYPNRTDYIRHYLPGSELLLAAAGYDERLIRTRQISTPLIRTSDPVRPLPPSVVKVLDNIRMHSSYASERYYYKGFLYYFADMFDAMALMHGWLRDGGILLLVAQDTYYKDIYVPTADLLIDLAVDVGLQPVARRDWRVRQHLSNLSPHSRRMMPKRTLSETLIGFSK